MEPDELEWLAQIASVATHLVEVGSWKGRSARALADHTDGTVYVVDNWCDVSERRDARGEEWRARGASAIEEDWHANLADHLTSGKVRLFRGQSVAMAAAIQLATGGVDFVFIDADHAREGVRRDLKAYAAIVKPGGILAGHDYTTKTHPGVKEAVDQAYGERVNQGPGSIWWVRL